MNNEHSGTLNISFKIKGTFEIFWNNLTVIVSLIFSRVPIWSFWHFKNFIKWLRDPNISQRFRFSKTEKILNILTTIHSWSTGRSVDPRTWIDRKQGFEPKLSSLSKITCHLSKIRSNLGGFHSVGVFYIWLNVSVLAVVRYKNWSSIQMSLKSDQFFQIKA